MAAYTEGEQPLSINGVSPEAQDLGLDVPPVADACVHHGASGVRRPHQPAKTLTGHAAPREGNDGEGHLQAERATMWRLQNAGAIADYNFMIETGGIPLSEFRKV